MSRCALVLHQSKLAKTKLNGIWRRAISKIWIESTGSQWYSSGKFSQDSLHCEFSTRFKYLWLNYSVNRSSSRTGASSCQCTTTLYGENEETQKNVFWILLRIQIQINWKWDLWIFGDTDWDSQCWRHIFEFNFISTGITCCKNTHANSQNFFPTK